MRLLKKDETDLKRVRLWRGHYDGRVEVADFLVTPAGLRRLSPEGTRVSSPYYWDIQTARSAKWRTTEAAALADGVRSLKKRVRNDERDLKSSTKRLAKAVAALARARKAGR